MKKITIILPSLLLAPLLFGCNKDSYSFSFHSDYCELNNKSHYSKKESEPITLTMTLKEGYEYCAVPDDIVVLIGRKEGVKGDAYEYEPILEDGEAYAKKATLTLTVTANISVTAKFTDSDNAFRIDPKKFDESINLTNEKYAQRAYMYLMDASVFNSLYYQEDYTSPTVYNSYTRRIESGHSYDPSEKYVEKSGDKYYKYDRDTASSPWQKEETHETEFIKTTNLSLKHLVVDLGNITYATIQNEYVKDAQSYEFETTSTEGKKYDVIMSFYNNRLTFLSYYGGGETNDTTHFGVVSFTYREITPTLPKVN